MAAVICLSMVFPAFAFYDVTLQEDGGVTGIATVKMTGILSQSTISLKRTYETCGQTETSVQPSCTVTVAVTFKPVSGAFDCPRDESCPMAAFDDLSLGAWYHDGVHYCIDEDIMKGVDDGVFAPDVSTSRAMIAVMLWRLDGSPDIDGQNPAILTPM